MNPALRSVPLIFRVFRKNQFLRLIDDVILHYSHRLYRTNPLIIVMPPPSIAGKCVGDDAACLFLLFLRFHKLIDMCCCRCCCRAYFIQRRCAHKIHRCRVGGRASLVACMDRARRRSLTIASTPRRHSYECFRSAEATPWRRAASCSEVGLYWLEQGARKPASKGPHPRFRDREFERVFRISRT